MNIIIKEYGVLSTGEKVQKYILVNDNNMSVEVLNYGGTISAINVPDRNNEIKNVVLGFEDIKGCKQKANFGTIVGRSAGRIKNSVLNIDGKQYKLNANNNENNLHGGIVGFDQKIWDASIKIEKDIAKLILHRVSADMEEGFPGELDVYVSYILNDLNELEIEYKYTSDKKTFVNMTNHSYFNLTGDMTKQILEHELFINADSYLEIDNVSIPKNISLVESTPFDFRMSKKIGQDISEDYSQLNLVGGYDHPFILNEGNEAIAKVYCEETGITLSVFSEHDCMVFYSANGLDGSLIGRKDTPMNKWTAFCLEPQDVPGNINLDFVEDKFTEPNKTYVKKTIYKFEN